MPKRKKPKERYFCYKCGREIILAEKIIRKESICTNCYVKRS